VRLSSVRMKGEKPNGRFFPGRGTRNVVHTSNWADGKMDGSKVGSTAVVISEVGRCQMNPYACAECDW